MLNLRTLVSFLFISILCISGASGQVATKNNVTVSKEVRKLEAKRLLAIYLSNYKGTGVEGSKLLEKVESAGLDKNTENVNYIRQAMASVSGESEKSSLTRVLASLHSFDNASSMNKNIEDDVRILAFSSGVELPRAAIFSYSRMGYFQDSLAVLSHGKAKGLLKDDEYFGELSHLLPYASPAGQAAIMFALKNSRNQYAAEILAAQIPQITAAGKLPSDIQIALKSVLSEQEPVMPMAIAAFGYRESFRYSNWLHAIATLESNGNQVAYNQFIFSKLNSKDIDSRKILAFLTSPEGKAFISNVGIKSSFKNILQKITLYSTSAQNNPLAIESISEVKKSVDLLPS